MYIPLLMAAAPTIVAMERIPWPPTPANMMSIFIFLFVFICWAYAIRPYDYFLFTLAFGYWLLAFSFGFWLKP
jgi:hypothetical protein